MTYEVGKKMSPEAKRQADSKRNAVYFEPGVGDKYVDSPPQTMPFNCSVCFFKASTFEDYIKHLCRGSAF